MKKRKHPIVRALVERVRRPATKQIMAGLLLTTPAGLMYMRGADELRPTSAPIVLESIEAVAAAPTDEQKRTIAEATLFAQEFKISTTLARTIVDAAKEAGVAFHGAPFRKVLGMAGRPRIGPTLGTAGGEAISTPM